MEITMLQEKLIDYRLLADACQFYRGEGYVQREVPWIVDAEFSRMTSPLPGDGFSFVLQDKRHLVASAEQGFVELALSENSDFTYNGRYFAVSPCFRDEPHDETHSKWFMKLELFSVHSKEAQAYQSSFKMADQARLFAIAQGCVDTWTQRTDIGYDLMVGDLEIGSYGIRKIGEYYIAYGTGAALPRLSVAIEKTPSGEGYDWERG
jgi:hypothetical protein